jgi:hypothetical protein
MVLTVEAQSFRAEHGFMSAFKFDTPLCYAPSRGLRFYVQADLKSTQHIKLSNPSQRGLATFFPRHGHTLSAPIKLPSTTSVFGKHIKSRFGVQFDDRRMQALNAYTGHCPNPTITHLKIPYVPSTSPQDSSVQKSLSLDKLFIDLSYTANTRLFRLMVYTYAVNGI